MALGYTSYEQVRERVRASFAFPDLQQETDGIAYKNLEYYCFTLSDELGLHGVGLYCSNCTYMSVGSC